MNPNYIDIDSLEDPRLAPFRNLRERTLRGESLFIAEGHLVAQRLLNSRFPTESVLLSREVREFLPSGFFGDIPGDVPVYTLPGREMLAHTAGFPFHQGILAAGRRLPLPDFPEAVREHKGSGIWVVLPNASKPDNLGLAFRSAAALGAAGVVLGERCCDPFSRRALRVSMGGVLQLPVIQAKNLHAELREVMAPETRLPGGEPPVETYGTVLADDAVILSEIGKVPRRAAILFGNEYDGLDGESAALCRRKVTIPMAPGVDSLNLGVSVGIFLYEFLLRQRQEDGADSGNKGGAPA